MFQQPNIAILFLILKQYLLRSILLLVAINFVIIDAM